MTFTLYDATAAAFLQQLTAVEGFMTRGLAHFHEKGIDPEEIVETRLVGDMLPFRFQALSVAAHSFGALQAVKAGLFKPGASMPPLDYAGLLKVVGDARAGVAAMTAEEVNALADKDVIFQLGERSMPFTGANFLLSFSTPNLHFHATTAYDILRMKGVPLGKRDYLGPLKLKM